MTPSQGAIAAILVIIFGLVWHALARMTDTWD